MISNRQMGHFPSYNTLIAPSPTLAVDMALSPPTYLLPMPMIRFAEVAGNLLLVDENEDEDEDKVVANEANGRRKGAATDRPAPALQRRASAEVKVNNTGERRRWFQRRENS